jgi:hypothetical protein
VHSCLPGSRVQVARSIAATRAQEPQSPAGGGTTRIATCMIKRRLRPGDPRQATGVPALVEHGLGCPLFLSDVMLTTLFSARCFDRAGERTGGMAGWDGIPRAPCGGATYGGLRLRPRIGGGGGWAGQQRPRTRTAGDQIDRQALAGDDPADIFRSRRRDGRIRRRPGRASASGAPASCVGAVS